MVRRWPGRRPVRQAWVAGVLGIALAATLSSCATGDPTPTVASVNFTPKLVLEAGDDGLRWRRGDRDDPAVTVDPAAAPRGTVVEVVNTGRHQHWLDAGATFDTGRMAPGERVTVVLSEQLTEPKTVTITDRSAPGQSTTIRLVPPPT